MENMCGIIMCEAYHIPFLDIITNLDFFTHGFIRSESQIPISLHFLWLTVTNLWLKCSKHISVLVTKNK